VHAKRILADCVTVSEMRTASAPPLPTALVYEPLLSQHPALDAQTCAVLSRVDRFAIVQRPSALEAATCGCCEEANSYAILDSSTGMPLLLAEERSYAVERCCCAPSHSLALDVYAMQPYSGYKAQQVLTIEREGCARKPCLCCPACCGCCADAATVYPGRVERFGSRGRGCALGVVEQLGACAAPFKPAVRLMDRAAAGAPLRACATVRGPMCFGGCAELCHDAPFRADGGAATLTKLRPRSARAALREAVSDADAYELHVADPTVGPARKAGLLAAALLLDYMLFECDSDVLACDGGRACGITCCHLYCCGAICPCKCVCACPGRGRGRRRAQRDDTREGRHGQR
jgi:hypothetical protein